MPDNLALQLDDHNQGRPDASSTMEPFSPLGTMKVFNDTFVDMPSALPFGVQSTEDCWSFKPLPDRLQALPKIKGGEGIKSTVDSTDTQLKQALAKSPLPFGVQSTEDKHETNEDDYELALSPLPFGVQSTEDKVFPDLVRHRNRQSPLPFGVQSTEDHYSGHGLNI